MLVNVALGSVLDGALDEVAHVFVRERIEDVFACAATRDDPLGAKKAKLLRDGGEPNARRIGKLRDAPLAIAQPIEELQAGEIAGGTENRGRAVELVVAHRRL